MLTSALVLLRTERYSATMNSAGYQPKGTRRLPSPERVKELLLADDPEYGRDLTDNEWGGITERLEALARLLWEFSCRKARENRAPHRPRRWPEHQTVAPGVRSRR